VRNGSNHLYHRHARGSRYARLGGAFKLSKSRAPKPKCRGLVGLSYGERSHRLATFPPGPNALAPLGFRCCHACESASRRGAPKERALCSGYAHGHYDFVYMKGVVYAVRKPAREAIGQDYPGHITLSEGGRVDYAGQARFGSRRGSGRGALREWRNTTGHYAPARGFESQGPFPTESFNPYVPDRTNARPTGPQLPVIRPVW
jgi:hypothetical protein